MSDSVLPPALLSTQDCPLHTLKVRKQPLLTSPCEHFLPVPIPLGVILILELRPFTMPSAMLLELHASWLCSGMMVMGARRACSQMCALLSVSPQLPLAFLMSPPHHHFLQTPMREQKPYSSVMSFFSFDHENPGRPGWWFFRFENEMVWRSGEESIWHLSASRLLLLPPGKGQPCWDTTNISLTNSSASFPAVLLSRDYIVTG